MAIGAAWAAGGIDPPRSPRESYFKGGVSQSKTAHIQHTWIAEIGLMQQLGIELCHF